MRHCLSAFRHWLGFAPACRVVPGSADGPLFRERAVRFALPGAASPVRRATA